MDFGKAKLALSTFYLLFNYVFLFTIKNLNLRI